MTPTMRKDEGKNYILPNFDGKTIDPNPEYTYSSPYIQRKEGSDVVTVKYRGRTWEYDFERNTVAGLAQSRLSHLEATAVPSSGWNERRSLQSQKNTPQ